MFVIEWKDRVEGVSGRTGVIYKQQPHDKTRVCNVTSWGMGSCAVATLQNWGWTCRVRLDELDSFFHFICEEVDEDWKPCEFYFLLSDSQKRREFKHLIQHPNVRLRDKFVNKSHGPNKVYLYRYSKALDFKRVVNKGKAKV
jgi:hypothetical protein